MEVEEFDDPLSLIPSGYDDGDTLEVGSAFTACTKNRDVEGEVSVIKKRVRSNQPKFRPLKPSFVPGDGHPVNSSTHPAALL